MVNGFAHLTDKRLSMFSREQSHLLNCSNMKEAVEELKNSFDGSYFGWISFDGSYFVPGI